MSDYLENLTAKALNPMQAIQPRLAALFEPPSAAGRPIAASLSANGEAAPGEPFSRGPSMDQSPGPWVNRQPSPLLTSQPVDTAFGQLSTQPGPHPARTISTATPVASSPPGAARPLDAKTAQPSHPDMPVLVPVSAGQETAAGPSTPSAEQERLSALEHIIGRAVDERAVLFGVSQSESIAHPESVSDDARRSSTPAMTVVQPHVTLYREPPVSNPPEGTSMPEPVPTIKITIGRVDVRAVMPAAPAPRPAPARPTPALSLEDYLKQRGGGRR